MTLQGQLQDSSPNGLWDVARAADYLDVPVGTVYSWVEAQPPRLPHLKLGRAVRFDPDELVAWARMQRRDRGDAA